MRSLPHHLVQIPAGLLPGGELIDLELAQAANLVLPGRPVAELEHSLGREVDEVLAARGQDAHLPEALQPDRDRLLLGHGPLDDAEQVIVGLEVTPGLRIGGGGIRPACSVHGPTLLQIVIHAQTYPSPRYKVDS